MNILVHNTKARQNKGLQDGRFSEGYASFKQVKPCPSHIEDIPGFSVVGLVTNKKLCQVVSGIVIKN